LPTLQIARSSFVKHRFRVFLLGYRIAAAPRGLAVVLAALFTAFNAVPDAAVAQAQKNDVASKGAVHIAAASDLQPVLPFFASLYEQRTGVKVVATFGSSASLTQMLQNGLPEDIFLSADTEHPQQLVKAGIATDLVPYAHGTLVLWARNDSPAQPLSRASLTSDKVMKIAVANDLHAPYGLAATQELKSLGIYEQLKPKLVVGENISQTAQFALTGNAQAALISLTIASSGPYRGAGSFWTLPKMYADIQQSGVVISASENRGAAIAFLAWFTSQPIQRLLTQYGLEPARRGNDKP
jgi:molybdate transport system substrate-binding protein